MNLFGFILKAMRVNNQIRVRWLWNRIDDHKITYYKKYVRLTASRIGSSRYLYCNAIQSSFS